MAIKIVCDICGEEVGLISAFAFRPFQEVYIKCNNPELADTRMDICYPCKRRLNKYVKNLKKEKNNV